MLYVHADVQWTAVSPNYLGRSMKIESVSSWRTFLTKLGVRKGIAVERLVEHVSKVMQVAVELFSVVCCTNIWFWTMQLGSPSLSRQEMCNPLICILVPWLFHMQTKNWKKEGELGTFCHVTSRA